MAELAVDPAQQPFYDALQEGRLELPFCDVCQRHDLPGTQTCPVCLSHDLRWSTASGAGTVYSFVVFRRALHPDFEVPYAVCVIELAEGPRLVAWLGEVDVDDVEIGMPVQAAIDGDAGATAPLRFRRTTFIEESK